MELDIIKLRTTWNDAAGSINSNYAKIADAIAQLKANGGGGGGGADIDLTDYATKVWVAANYAPLTSVQGFENRIGGLESAVPQLNNRVTTVEGKVSSLNEIVSTGENNLLGRVNVIEEEYATKTYVDNAIDGIDLSPYLKTDDAEDTYATKDFVDNKLVDYAPLTSVQGFENRIGGLEGAVPQLNDRVTTVESKVSSLNEIVSTGENNLLDRVNVIEQEYATMTYVDNAIDGIDLSAYLLKADLTKSRIQSTLGISDWALSATKPSYAWSEITSRPTALSQFTDDVVSGKYLPLRGGTLTDALTVKGSGSPLTVHRTQSLASVVKFVNTDGVLGMLGVDVDKTAIFITASGVIKKLLHSGNYSDYALPITGGTINGSITATSFIGNLTGNADSATKLQTPRTLWGQSFDGTAKIGGDITLDAYQDGRQFSIRHSGDIYFFTPPSNNWVTSLSIFANDKTTLLTSAFGVYGTGEDVRYAFIGGTYYNPNVVVKDDTRYVGIGTTSPTEKLEVAGNVKASGNINATSITINGVTITASNGSITVNGNVFATGDITGGV